MMRPVVFVTLAVLFQAASAKHVQDPKNNVGVYGGDLIRIEQAPWMALVHTSEDVPCAGTIVDKRFILTVDNCCRDNGNPRSKWIARVGTDGRTSQGLIIKIQDAYKYKNSEEDYNLKPSLCLLKLDRPLSYSSKVQQASYQEPYFPIRNGTLLDFIAFGRPSLHEESHGLRRARLPVDDPDWCKEERKRLNDGQICAGDHNHNACAGDAGGALTAGRYLIGVLTEATQDCYSNPSRFSRISHYRPWITKYIQENQ